MLLILDESMEESAFVITTDQKGNLNWRRNDAILDAMEINGSSAVRMELFLYIQVLLYYLYLEKIMVILPLYCALRVNGAFRETKVLPAIRKIRKHCPLHG